MTNLLLGSSNLQNSTKLFDEEKKEEQHLAASEVKAIPDPINSTSTHMSSSEFLGHLAQLDTTQPGNLEGLLLKTQLRSAAYIPELIPIGSHHGLEYFVGITDVELPSPHEDDIDSVNSESFPEVETSNGSSQAESPELYPGLFHFKPQNIASSSTSEPIKGLTTEPATEQTLQSIIEPTKPTTEHTTKPPEYGFALGRLRHQSPDDSHSKDTGFYVICDAYDTSIWIAFDFESYGSFGEREKIEPRFGDAYGQFPGDENKNIGLQKLYAADWKMKKPLSLYREEFFRRGCR